MIARRDELRGRLAAVRSRIERACLESGRNPDDVKLVAVTKFHPASDISELAGLGVHDFGESRAKEFVDKAESLALPLTWHFVGQLQTNKAAQVAAKADVVHSVDRFALVEALSRGAERHGRELSCLVQVNFTGDSNRGGVPSGDGEAVQELASQIVSAPRLTCSGVMAVAPFGRNAGEIMPRLREISALVREVEPLASFISAGMSNDFEEAVSGGATHIRIGSALLGSRPVLR